jgi:signal transduction histidine kinase
MNLLSNGEKYSGDRREITVECRAENGMAVIDILDRGIGVDPRHSEKIFQEFFREDDSLAAPKGGAGLGLSIARDIARRHGGDVLYAPRDGGGSIFSLLLPFDGTGENFRG